MSKEIVIITGGASGLGLELVKQFMEKNYFVCNIDRDFEKMKILNNTYKGNYEGFIGDISDSRFVKEVINKISNLGNIRILINNAGEPSFKLPTKYEKEDIDKCFKGLQGMILFSTETLKVKEEKDLKIVNIMSSAALRGNKQEAVYCATKWGERGYTESLKVAYKGTSVGEPSFKLPTKYEKEDIDKCFKGLQGMILFSTETLKVKEEKDLKIVNIMSSAALRGNKQEAVYCATKWGERGYTESLKVAYKGTSVKVIGVYPGGINTEFYKNSRDYVSVEKSNSFMKPEDVAKTIINNVITDTNLTVADIIIERN